MSVMAGIVSSQSLSQFGLHFGDKREKYLDPYLNSPSQQFVWGISVSILKEKQEDKM